MPLFIKLSVELFELLNNFGKVVFKGDALVFVMQDPFVMTPDVKALEQLWMGAHNSAVAEKLV